MDVKRSFLFAVQCRKVIGIGGVEIMKAKIMILFFVLISISVQQAHARYYQSSNGRCFKL